jgi:hypothetical protein
MNSRTWVLGQRWLGHVVQLHYRIQLYLKAMPIASSGPNQRTSGPVSHMHSP